MPEVDPLGAGLQEPTPHESRRLPWWIRYPVAAILGVLLAVLASYLVRKIGF
jgi:hypothetical protein